MAFITHWCDIVNALFELAGGIFVWLNVAAIRRDKGLKGIRWEPQLVFTIWGFWNIFYYQHLGQIWSAVASVSVVLANGAWLWLVWKYWRIGRIWRSRSGEGVLEDFFKAEKILRGSTTPRHHPWRSGRLSGRVTVIGNPSGSQAYDLLRRYNKGTVRVEHQLEAIRKKYEPLSGSEQCAKIAKEHGVEILNQFVKNPANFFFSTGHVDAIFPKHKDRRFFVAHWWAIDFYRQIETILAGIRKQYGKTHDVTVIQDEVVITPAPAGDLPAIAQAAYPVEICEHACDIKFCYICRSGSV